MCLHGGRRDATVGDTLAKSGRRRQLGTLAAQVDDRIRLRCPRLREAGPRPGDVRPDRRRVGLPALAFTAWVTSLIELGGGILLMLGAFVVPLSLPLAAMTAVAMFGVHLRYGFLAIKLKTLSAAGAEFGPPGYEITLLYLAGIATLVLSGSIPLSIDRLLESRRSIDEVSRSAQAGASGERAAKVPPEPERAA